MASGTKERQIQVDRLPLDMVERIELIRAPGASLSNEGLMGAINIVLREAPKQRVTNAGLVTGRVFGEKTDKDTWNLASTATPGAACAAAQRRHRAEGRREDQEQGRDHPRQQLANAATARKLEFEDERVTMDTFDFSPRLNVKLSGVGELVFMPWITRSDETKTKEV